MRPGCFKLGIGQRATTSSTCLKVKVQLVPLKLTTRNKEEVPVVAKLRQKRAIQPRMDVSPFFAELASHADVFCPILSGGAWA